MGRINAMTSEALEGHAGLVCLDEPNVKPHTSLLPRAQGRFWEMHDFLCNVPAFSYGLEGCVAKMSLTDTQESISAP